MIRPTLLASAGLSLFLAACSQGALPPAVTPPDVLHTVQAQAGLPLPPELALPASAAVFRRLIGVGVQLYTCAAPAGVPAWTFRAPEADLYGGEAGTPRRVGIHFAGPTWEDAADGSTVVGRVLRSVPAPASVPPAIPWLLLEARATTPARGGSPGAFTRTIFVRRLYTVGGTAPHSGCGAGTLGTEVRVPYAALYEFAAP